MYFTIKCKLVCKENDIGGYIIYVFKNLEINPPFGYQFCMLTRWPNWQCRDIEIGEVGYVTYQEVRSGIDTWYDGTKFVPYNYSNNVFIRFVEEKDNSKKDIIL